jgi:hypothetical protein
LAGKVDQAGGIAVRLIDANNYYVVRKWVCGTQQV